MNSKYKYSLLDGKTSKQSFVNLNFGKVAICTLSLPFFAFNFCILWSIFYNFEDVTRTHCNVYNFLPSISSAIGEFEPQKTVWRLAIFMDALPRLIIVSIYYDYFQRMLRFPIICTIITILSAIENLALLCLTFWSSSDNFPMHKTSFISFVFTSEIYMLLVCVMFQKYVQYPLNSIENFSLKVKWKLLLINVIAFTLASYFYGRHQWYCEPGSIDYIIKDFGNLFLVYSLFAFSEYIVVLTNMAYHMTAYWDFFGKNLIIDSYGAYAS